MSRGVWVGTVILVIWKKPDWTGWIKLAFFKRFLKKTHRKLAFFKRFLKNTPKIKISPKTLYFLENNSLNSSEYCFAISYLSTWHILCCILATLNHFWLLDKLSHQCCGKHDSGQQSLVCKSLNHCIGFANWVIVLILNPLATHTISCTNFLFWFEL